ncbi:cupin domain-containing protein [Hoeflea sp. IMCC20628]|uniref:cupin domain-containing protein n=1 Tax=Hoeflea sp. IMCC20628 TaxID=1620421 RepID=UPI00063A9556|nr:cupin domain-containing protein [Hoeflea sp. IMCC20628]AKI00720.1 cupin domain-containing protein [Hoeflea sp. IMCC20628]
MELNIRRVVTGHDENGKAIVKFDDLSDTVISRRPGHKSAVLWTTDRFPSDNAGQSDAAKREIGTTDPNGTVFRVVEYQAGVAGRLHRTDSVDYAVVMSGSIDMELDDGVVVTLSAGDALVQRGTVHNWVNRGPEPCRIFFVLVAAEPVSAEAGGKLAAFG